ncbi:hypothetical protein JOF56_002466 [Kibdelosporangium banguiense]|uniref:ABC transporter n=1 Tax=Kibdelosporangium banguiense TaxID=1365924 RepID=A0ABS4TCC0_9PSEU|nr:hypothetical protein [Kibdelosporangium banguiense]MBP2322081.1 hypothetical protein [Kibdelosporangium banguiense]
MISLVRYLLADVLRTQRWVPPLLTYLVALMIIGPPTGPVLPTYAMAAAALVPIGMWLTVVVFHSEEPAQAAMTMAITGGFGRVWPAKVLTALLCTLVLGLVSLIWLTVTANQYEHVGVGFVDYVMTALAGVAFGTLISRPVLTKISWTALVGVGICLAQLLIRQAPPVNAMIDLYADRSPSPGPILVIAAETLVLSALVIGLAHVLARRRI